MVKTLKLKASDGKALVFNSLYENKGSDYGSLSLETGNEAVILGKERWFKHIRTYMFSRLRPPYKIFPEKGDFGGGEKLWYFQIVALENPHATLYGVPVRQTLDGNDLDATEGMDLFWQQSGLPCHIIRLTNDDIQSWLKILEKTEPA
jgi:hypothetical protein